MTASCIIIPQWVFAVVGVAICIVCVWMGYIKYQDDTLHEIVLELVFTFSVGITVIIVGIFPYLPCVQVLP
jgi:RsiW-degrading membrane proteinase PrsW (M82 family)